MYIVSGVQGESDLSSSVSRQHAVTISVHSKSNVIAKQAAGWLENQWSEGLASALHDSYTLGASAVRMAFR